MRLIALICAIVVFAAHAEHVEFDEDELHDYGDINVELFLKSLFQANNENIGKYSDLKRYFGNDSIPDKDIFSEQNKKLEEIPYELHATVLCSQQIKCFFQSY